MKTYTLQFTIDETIYPPPAWENAYQLAFAFKYLLENRYGYEQVVDVQPRVTEKPKPIRAFCVVRK